MEVKRLQYIGSKHNLLAWILDAMREEVGALDGARVLDAFAGTGIVAHALRAAGAVVSTNDAERYSAVVAHVMAHVPFHAGLEALVARLDAEPATRAGFITTHYSPYGGCERMYFTVENAMRIDHIRARIAELEHEVSADDAAFLLASLLVSADAVSNVPAVYGCYLKAFKERAQRPLRLVPVHREGARGRGEAFQHDVLSDALLGSGPYDAVYLDPPYNQRQYSKNYFPLNAIVHTPTAPLRGKTGIPADCFLSAFCRRADVAAALDTLCARLRARWIFVSYSSEGLLTRDEVVACLARHGDVSVRARPYKRFKSFEYNASAPVEEYLFCLRKTS